jgi:hypothetical protein
LRRKTAATAPAATIAADASLLVERELRAAVKLPATLVMLGAELLLLAIADRAEALRAHSGGYQPLFGRIGAIFAQSQVVFS